MASEQDGFSAKLWMRVKKDAAFIAYSPFALKFFGRLKRNPKEWSSSDELVIGRFLESEKRLFKALLLSYCSAKEFIEDADMKSQIKHLGDSFELIRPTDHFKSLKNIFTLETEASDDFRTKHFVNFIFEKSYHGDNPQQNAFCAIIPLVVHLRAFVSLAEDHFPIDIRSKLLQCFYIEYSKILSPVEELLNKLCASVNVELLENHYRSSLLQEIYFYVSTLDADTNDLVPLLGPRFHGSYDVQFKVKKNLTIVVSLGSTCVSEDVNDSMSELQIVLAERVGQDTQMKTAWESLVVLNSTETEICIEKMLQMNKRNDFDFPALSEAMKQLSELESKMRSKVLDKLVGVGIQKISLAVDSVQFCYGWERFLRAGVLSDMIFYMTSHAGFQHLLKAKLSAMDLKLKVLPTHIISESYSTANEKFEMFQRIPNSGSNSLTICIGQSLSELLCLVQADIGIVMGSDANLKKVAENFGVRLIPLFEWIVGKECEECMDTWGSKIGRLFTVES